MNKYIIHDAKYSVDVSVTNMEGRLQNIHTQHRFIVALSRLHCRNDGHCRV